MKNIFLAVAFLATFAVSCEKQEATAPVQEPVEVETIEVDTTEAVTSETEDVEDTDEVLN